MKKGRIIPDEEIKLRVASEQPYRHWLDNNKFELEDLPDTTQEVGATGCGGSISLQQQAFGYTTEELNKIIKPMVTDGKDPVGSMGYDSPLAVLSKKPQLLYNYFKQLFAQVTNPPIDAIREQIITSVGTTIGAEGNLVNPAPESCQAYPSKDTDH